jgi:hypothetical protein
MTGRMEGSKGRDVESRYGPKEGRENEIRRGTRGEKKATLHAYKDCTHDWRDLRRCCR